MIAFFSALGYVMALISNTIWALAHSLNPMDAHVFYDSIDTAIMSGMVVWGAAYGTVKIEEIFSLLFFPVWRLIFLILR